jgi:hypothetical protein
MVTLDFLLKLKSVGASRPQLRRTSLNKVLSI